MKLVQYLNTNLNGELIWPNLNFMGPGNNAILETKEIENSILKKAVLKKTVEYYTHLDIEIEFNGRTYSTAIIWDDQTLLRSFYEILRDNLGKSMKEIGNCEWPS